MKQTVVITGANRGIGLALADCYKRAGADVIAVCRQTSAALEDLSVRIIGGVDLLNKNAIQQLRQQLDGVVIDILINNAGVLVADAFDGIDYESVIQQFKVNSLAPLQVTEALADKLQSGSKVALITSRMGSIADNSSGGTYGYRMSKAALNAAGMSLSHDLRPREVAVGLFHPGYVQTDMVGGNGDISAQQCAERLLLRIADLELSNSGGFWHSNGEMLPW